jgi:hypothetical protein
MTRFLRDALLAGLLGPAFASAMPVTYYFIGTVTGSPTWLADPTIQVPGYAGPTFDANPFSAVTAGTAVQGSFTYDTEARIPLAITGRAYYRSGPEPGQVDPTSVYSLSASFGVGGNTYRSFNSEILIDNDFSSDRYVVLGTNRIAGASSFFTASLNLDGGASNLWDSTALPESPPTLAELSSADFTLNYYIFLQDAGADYYQPIAIHASLSSLQLRAAAMPEPGTLALLALGLAGLGYSRRKQ